MKILFCGYRDWAEDILAQMTYCYDTDIDIVSARTQEEYAELIKNEYDFVLFVGWSWIIPAEIVNSKVCLCVHPSPLPKYRGGSPIQNQIINGETKSAVTLFIMNEKIDDGVIVRQSEYSLEGDLDEIFDSMKAATFDAITDLIEEYRKIGKMVFDEEHTTKQDLSKKSYFKRRTPEQSEITVEEIQNSTPEQLYNKIRALQDPYPNAFIRCKDGKKLYLTKAKPE